jgi:hypothetical protein
MLAYEDLESEAERLLWERIESAELVDRRVGDPEQDDPANGAAWDNERSARAELLIELVTTERRPSGQRPRALHLRGARVIGTLNFEGLTLVCPLTLEECSFEQGIVLDEARASSVRVCTG